VPITETDLVVHEILVSARPETVFEFFIDPRKMTRWKGRKAELDPRPGGIYRVEISDQATARGEYVEIVPNERVVFTWGWEGEGMPVPPGSSTVEITLTPENDKTLVRLVHRDLPVEARESHDDGWSKFLPRLAAVLEGRDPGPDPHDQIKGRISP
jgi:uncharacterized protein YndB with AHSA1/START domain